ncbi:MAG TPA: hypothetical protein VGQ00_01595 [Candidatus Norongarragalinales archaeon]|jgi:DNA-directed RNA polymerase subunit RPC12/RpoP|nr:hypothetical protein [Candidatus Norongarragalinales archaeon]
MYISAKCGKKFKPEDVEFLRCPYCGSKVFYKETEPIARKATTA